MLCCVLCAPCYVLCALCSVLCAKALEHCYLRYLHVEVRKMPAGSCTCTYRPCASTANSTAPAQQNAKMLSLSVLQTIRTCMHTSYVSQHTKSSGALLFAVLASSRARESCYMRVLAHNRVQVPANSSAPEQRSAEALYFAVLQAVTCQKYCVLSVKQSADH